MDQLRGSSRRSGEVGQEPNIALMKQAEGWLEDMPFYRLDMCGGRPGRSRGRIRAGERRR